MSTLSTEGLLCHSTRGSESRPRTAHARASNRAVAARAKDVGGAGATHRLRIGRAFHWRRAPLLPPHAAGAARWRNPTAIDSEPGSAGARGRRRRRCALVLAVRALMARTGRETAGCAQCVCACSPIAGRGREEMPLLSSDLACMGRVTCSESIGLVRRAGELTHMCLSHLCRKERGQPNGCLRRLPSTSSSHPRHGNTASRIPGPPSTPTPPSHRRSQSETGNPPG